MILLCEHPACAGARAPNQHLRFSLADQGHPRNWTYGYDDFNRLSSASKTGASYTYDYDRYGNRWHQNGPLAFVATFSSGNNRQDPSNGSSYDAAGNMTNDGLGHSFTYDAENRIIQAGTTTYAYDGEGRRIRRTAGGWSFDFFYDLANHEVAEMSMDGGWTRGEIFAADRHIATYSSGTTFFNHVDWLGTERARTAMSGGVSETCVSLPFGDGQSCSGSDTSPNHFTGKERDAETGDDYFGARYYSSMIGRWMSPDWSDTPTAIPYASLMSPKTLNLYSYVTNNPLNEIDSLGHLHAPAAPPGGAEEPIEPEPLREEEKEAEKDPETIEALSRRVEAAEQAREANQADESFGQVRQNSAGVWQDPQGVCHAGPMTREQYDQQVANNQGQLSGINFAVTPKGEVIPIPQGASGPLPTRSAGMQFQGGSGGSGMDARVTGVRIMDATARQGPRVSYNNAQSQKVDPVTGHTISNAHPAAHIPLKP